GIRDFHVTGVQTCALPIFSGLEVKYESHLATSATDTAVARDGFGKLLHVSEQLSSLPKGNPLALTLDASIQLIVDEELEAGRAKIGRASCRERGESAVGGG